MSRRVVSSGDEEDLGEDASKQGRRINDIDADEDITVVNVQDNADNEMFDVDALNDEEVFVAEQEIANEKDDDGEIILAQALIEMKSTKPMSLEKAKGIMIEEPVLRLRLIMNWLKYYKQRSEKSCLLKKRHGGKAELQSLMKVIPDEEEVAIDVVPLATAGEVTTASTELLLLVEVKNAQRLRRKTAK
ncbi:hypothetical protein Tco_1561580 [Tanacetum coccineum]